VRFFVAGKVKKEAKTGDWQLKSETASAWFSPYVQEDCHV